MDIGPSLLCCSKFMAAIAVGTRLSHFAILEKLGEGGMGVVYKARDERLDRVVAIKVLPEKAVSDPERQARFIQEAKAASALNHPNIVTVHEIDTASGITFIAMECIDGRTLDEVIPQKGLRFAEALLYAVQMADALAAAHSIGIIHRDLKPANIMISGKGRVKVLDFGLAKLTQPDSSGEIDATVSMRALQTDPGSIAGTAAYMSPEQAEGKPIDARSDIFSFGVVLYEMLTGRRPFRGDTKLSILAAIVNQEPTPARQLVETLPAEMERVLGRCLRKDPERRFQTMADLRVALQELKEESDSGRLVAAAGLATTHKRRWVWVVSAALFVLVTAGVWLASRGRRPQPAQTVVPVTTYPGNQQQPCFSPDGNQVAFSWDGEKGDNFDIYVKLLGEPNALRLTTDAAEDRHPAWSPDGKRIAFERSDAKGPAGIYTISPLAGTERKLTDFPGNSQMSWSPDGKWLAASSNTPEFSGIFLLPIEGGEPRRISSPKAPVSDSAPSFSPDGHRLAYESCTEGIWSCDLYVQELDSAYAPQGGARRITRQSIALITAVAGVAWSRDGESLIYNGSLTSPDLSYLWRVGVRDQGPPQRFEIGGPRADSPSFSSKGDRLLFSRSQSDYDIWRYHTGGGMEPLLVSSLSEFNPQFSPDGTRIAFESNRSGEAEEIWIANADGSGAVQMTNRLGRFQGTPRWSPDGRWIAFDSQGQDGRWDIYVMDASGGRARRITFEPSDEVIPSWSRDGKWIYFASNRTGRYEVWRVPFFGGLAEQVTTNGGHTAYESADGKTLFYIKDDSSPLFSRALTGGPERQLLEWVQGRAFVPVEEGIYFIGRRTANKQFPLQFFQFSTNTSRLLTNIDGGVFNGLSVSPDRKTILFTKTVSVGANVMMIENFQ
jgi:eukaryotic-like serine/threonine-protein kinase